MYGKWRTLMHSFATRGMKLADKRQCLWAIAVFNSQTIEDQPGIKRMRDPRATTSAITELNKMVGAYNRKNDDDWVTVNFIQQFGDDEDY